MTSNIPKLIFAVLFALTCHHTVSADIFSTPWSTNSPSNSSPGAFGTPESVSDGNAISARISDKGLVSTVRLAAESGEWFRTTGAPNVTNKELAPFVEDVTTRLTFTSSLPLQNVDILLHNVWNSGANGVSQTNYIGDFSVTYENGIVVHNALPTLRSINNDSPFATDFEGGTLQPSGINSIFDGGNKLVSTDANFNPGNGAALARYWFDPSDSITSETQGFGVFSFDKSHGAIEQIEFTWVGNTGGRATAFIGFAGLPVLPTAVPEPTSAILIAGFSCLLLTRRNRRLVLA